MKRKLAVVENDNNAENETNIENGCRPTGKKHCNINGALLHSPGSVKAEPDCNAESKGPC